MTNVRPHIVIPALTTWIDVQADAVRVERFQIKVSRHTQLHRFHPRILHIEDENPAWLI